MTCVAGRSRPRNCHHGRPAATLQHTGDSDPWPMPGGASATQRLPEALRPSPAERVQMLNLRS